MIFSSSSNKPFCKIPNSKISTLTPHNALTGPQLRVLRCSNFLAVCYTILLLERVFEGAFAADVVVGLGAGGNAKKDSSRKRYIRGPGSRIRTRFCRVLYNMVELVRGIRTS